MEIKKSEEEEDEEEISRNLIYICMRIDSNTYKHDWYVFDRNNNNHFYYEDELSKLNLHRGFRCAVLGQEIYIICFQEFDDPVPVSEPCLNSKEVKIYHTGKREWRNGEPMLLARHGPTVAVLQGKIYVFGSVIFNTKQPWAEFYDPSSKKWYPVNNIPSQSDLITHFLEGHAIISQTQILLWTVFCEMLMFDAHEEQWAVLSSSDFRRSGNGPFIPVVTTKDNVIYWFYGDSLFAYDLAKNDKSLPSSSHGGPIFTFDNIWDGPVFDPARTNSYMVIDTIGKQSKMKDEACFIWCDYRAGSVFYTHFELFEQEADYDKRESSKGVKWCGRYHSLEFIKNKQQEYFDPLYLDHETRYHVDVTNDDYLIAHCLPVVKSSSSKDVVNEEPRQGSYSHHHKHLDLYDIYDTMFKQIAACTADRDIREKELSAKVLQSVKIQEQDEEHDMSMEEFLHKHEIQELSDIFKARNLNLVDLKRMGEERLRNFKFPRNLKIKLAMALGWPQFL